MAKSGAKDVYSVVGYGNWNNIQTIKMNKAGYNAFEADVTVNSGETINIAFKDGAEHWDNNSGLDYTITQ
ncbi:MAG: hypothetical protein MJE63_04095 [Proteobacteria bacterium]|nr:hypothetical protein [Pseudomonadota bacterium]